MQRLRFEERKKQIIESAINLFAKNGFNGTRTKDIAKKARVSEALIFKFFPTKLSLYTAIIEYRINQAGSSFELLEQSFKTEKEFLKDFALAHIDKIEKDDTFMRILLFSALEGHKLSKMFFNKINKVLLTLAKYIENKIKEGIFKNIDPILAARIFMGMIYNYLLLKKIFQVDKPPLADKNTAAEVMVNIFLNGITNI